MRRVVSERDKMKFRYDAVDEAGDRHSGEHEAEGLFQAAEQLRGKGWSVLTLELVELPSPAPVEGMDAFVFFNRSLADLTRIGMPLTAAVRQIASGLEKGRFRSSLDRVESALKEGRPLDQAFQEGDFPETYRWLVRAGLRSGRLPAVLSAVADHAQTLKRLRRGLLRAIVYPALVLVAGLSLAGLLGWFIYPAYAAAHKTFKMAPPEQTGLTYVLVGTVLFVALVSGLAWAGWIARGRPEGEKRLWSVPLLGPVLRGLCLERFFASLQILIDARVPLNEAAPVALLASGSAQFVAEIPSITHRLSQGRTLATCMEPMLPLSYVNTLSGGERTGRLSEAVRELRARVLDDCEWNSENLFMVLEPSAILFTGVAMAGVCLTLLRPYLELIRGIQSGF